MSGSATVGCMPSPQAPSAEDRARFEKLRPTNRPDFKRILTVVQLRESASIHGHSMLNTVAATRVLFPFAAQRINSARSTTVRTPGEIHKQMGAMFAQLGASEYAQQARRAEQQATITEFVNMRVEGFLFGQIFEQKGGRRTQEQDSQRLWETQELIAAVDWDSPSAVETFYAKYVDSYSLIWVMTNQIKTILATDPQLYPTNETQLRENGTIMWIDGFIYGVHFEKLGGHAE